MDRITNILMGMFLLWMAFSVFKSSGKKIIAILNGSLKKVDAKIIDSQESFHIWRHNKTRVYAPIYELYLDGEAKECSGKVFSSRQPRLGTTTRVYYDAEKSEVTTLGDTLARPFVALLMGAFGIFAALSKTNFR